MIPREVLMAFLRAAPGGAAGGGRRVVRPPGALQAAGDRHRACRAFRSGWFRGLLRWGARMARPSPEGLLIRNRPTQQELANQIGACRETVSRTVSELVRQGLLTPRGRSLLVSKQLVEGSA